MFTSAKSPFLRLILATFLLSTLPFAHANEDAVSLLKKMDELFRSDSSTSTMKMTIVTPNWQRTLEMKSWTRQRRINA